MSGKRLTAKYVIWLSLVLGMTVTGLHIFICCHLLLYGSTPLVESYGWLLYAETALLTGVYCFIIAGLVLFTRHILRKGDLL